MYKQPRFIYGVSKPTNYFASGLQALVLARYSLLEAEIFTLPQLRGAYQYPLSDSDLDSSSFR